jgi:acetyl-CoA carboxylase biotin carboxyl carrier protein
MGQDFASLDDVCDSALRLVKSAPGAVTRVRLQQGEAVVEMEWAGEVAVPVVSAAAVPPAAVAGAEADAEDATIYLRAPMIGTFYRSAAPGEPPFVHEGDLVEVGTQVGILEAMKLMNPIEADRAGRIAKVLVADATPVEYDQPLIALVPADEQAGDE